MYIISYNLLRVYAYRLRIHINDVSFLLDIEKRPMLQFATGRA